MSSPTDDLLSALVGNIRQACEQHITFKDFTSVSGLICFDIDGLKQQCFVISELLQKRSVGEGHSAHLKTLNWKDIDTPQLVVQHGSRNSSSKPSFIEKSNCNKPLDDQIELSKCPNGPQTSFAILQTKLDWSNRTFTLKAGAQYETGPSNHYSLDKTSTTTITLSKEDTHKEGRENSQSEHKKNIHQGVAREANNNFGKKGTKNYNSTKLNIHNRNCYPGLPKKPMKRCKPFYNENKEERQTTCCIDSKSEALKEVDQDSYRHFKALYNCPSEKPTALSWFETMISPSSSFESIDSIQPCYLVPHSEPLSNSPYCKTEAKRICESSSYDCFPSAVDPLEYTSNNFENAAAPGLKLSNMNHTHYCTKDESQDKHVTAPLEKQESPLKTIAALSTTSNGTLNTISSIEADAITLKENSPQKSFWKAMESAEAHAESQILSECSAISKKRASLMKWMGLFKKGSKASANAAEVGSVQRNVTKVKPRRNTPEPPIAIRLKQWN